MIYQREQFLSPSECEELLALFPPSAPGNVEENSSVHRQSRVTFIDHPVAEQIYRTMLEVNERFYRFDVSGHEQLQLAEYRSGDEYDWHLDFGPKEAAKRKLSASIQLSKPNIYDGGDLQFWGGKPVTREQGALIIFPSYILHRVTLVTRGVRHSLVAWAIGVRSFR